MLVYIIGLIFYDHCLTVLFKGEQDLKTRQKVLSSQKPFIFYYPFDRKVPLGSKFLFLLIGKNNLLITLEKLNMIII